MQKAGCLDDKAKNHLQKLGKILPLKTNTLQMIIQRQIKLQIGGKQNHYLLSKHSKKLFTLYIVK